MSKKIPKKVVGISFDDEIYTKLEEQKLSFGRSTLINAALNEFFKKDKGEKIKSQLDWLVHMQGRDA
jgi:metal-responsive CopG/Arc/MetJ family transcriptional regulator